MRESQLDSSMAIQANNKPEWELGDIDKFYVNEDGVSDSNATSVVSIVNKNTVEPTIQQLSTTVGILLFFNLFSFVFHI